jgi:hypothetical protein
MPNLQRLSPCIRDENTEMEKHVLVIFCDGIY